MKLKNVDVRTGDIVFICSSHDDDADCRDDDGSGLRDM